MPFYTIGAYLQNLVKATSMYCVGINMHMCV